MHAVLVRSLAISAGGEEQFRHALGHAIARNPRGEDERGGPVIVPQLMRRGEESEDLLGHGIAASGVRACGKMQRRAAVAVPEVGKRLAVHRRKALRPGGFAPSAEVSFRVVVIVRSVAWPELEFGPLVLELLRGHFVKQLFAEIS
jgi:hypothetical protein